MSSEFLSHDSDWWNTAMVVALVFAFLAAGLVAAATTGVIVVQKREAISAKEDLEKYKAAAAGQLAEAKLEGIKAGKAAGDADLKAAQATARAAEAELALAKYRAGRSLTEEQKNELVAVLRSAPKGPVIIKPNFLSPEPTRYADELSAVFNEAGFSGVGDKPLSVVSTNKPGIFVVVRNKDHMPPQTVTIAEALKKANIPFTAHQEDYVPDENTVVILIGERP
jgi:hypothetical protein